MKTTLHMLATLIVVGMLSGAGLSLMNGWASPLIAENQRKVRDAAINFLVPGGSPQQAVDTENLTAWRVVGDDGALKGWVVRASGIGFQAEIDLMIALDPDRQEIRGLKVLQDSETPGLGTWIRLGPDQQEALAASDTRDLGDAVSVPQNFPLQFFGYGGGEHLSAAGDLEVIKGKGRDALGPTEVQVITAATISSKAVVDIINDAVTRLDAALAGEGGVS